MSCSSEMAQGKGGSVILVATVTLTDPGFANGFDFFRRTVHFVDQYQWLLLLKQDYSCYIAKRTEAIGTGMNTSPTNITRLLHQWQDGDKSALAELSPLIYAELHRLAGNHMRRERSGHTLQTTALVNEVFTRLADTKMSIKDRHHFYRIAAQQMRRILVDHARARQCQKRGTGSVAVTLDENRVSDPHNEIDLLSLDEALHRLREFDECKHDIIELIYFAGLSHKETASLLNISQKTVQRELRFTEAWLHDALTTPRH